jgi:hypothetical protein
MVESRLITNSNRPVALLATKAVEITPSDDTFFSPCSLYVGTGGTMKVVFPESLTTVITLVNIPDGTILPILVVKVLATDLTADDIVGLY